MTKRTCPKCKELLESKHRHDFVMCKKECSYLDGGDEYIRLGGALAEEAIEKDVKTIKDAVKAIRERADEPDYTPELSQAEKIEVIAMKVMGWEAEKQEIESCIGSFTRMGDEPLNEVTTTVNFWKSVDGEYVFEFNPYTDWNHTHMVLDKAHEQQILDKRFFSALKASDYESINGVPKTDLGIYADASKEQLMDAIVSILNTPER